LIAARPDTTVTDVAMRWGFTHFGRFAEIYRNRFGCTPREALKAARGSDFGD
jgi:AraC-like DNA-binding protein